MADEPFAYLNIFGVQKRKLTLAHEHQRSRFKKNLRFQKK
jgi:hypothetical protein